MNLQHNFLWQSYSGFGFGFVGFLLGFFLRFWKSVLISAADHDVTAEDFSGNKNVFGKIPTKRSFWASSEYILWINFLCVDVKTEKKPKPALLTWNRIHKHTNIETYKYIHMYRLFQKRCLGNILRKSRSYISSLTSVPSWHGIDNSLSSQKGKKSSSTSSALVFPHTAPVAMLNKENDHGGCSFCLQIL